MGVSVYVNARSIAHTGAGGKAVCMTPDVCKTPAAPSPVPVPYPNVAQDSDGTQGSRSVKCDGESVLLKNSKFRISTGDEAGTVGGVISSKFKGSAKFATYTFDVKIEGKNIGRHLDMTLMNGNGFNDNGTYTFNAGSPTVDMSRKPTAKECQTAIKLLGDYKGRLKAYYGAKAAEGMLKKLSKIPAGQISIANVMFCKEVFPGIFREDSAGRFRSPSLTKTQIEEICGGS